MPPLSAAAENSFSELPDLLQLSEVAVKMEARGEESTTLFDDATTDLRESLALTRIRTAIEALCSREESYSDTEILELAATILKGIAHDELLPVEEEEEEEEDPEFTSHC